MSVETALNTTLSPLRRHWHNIEDPSSERAARKLRWFYLVLSFGVFWFALGYVEEHREHWIRHGLLSALFLAVAILFSAWTIPHWIRALFQAKAVLVKVAIVINYVTLLLFLDILVGAWWSKALVLASMVGVTCFGVWLVYNVFGPGVVKLREFYRQESGMDQDYDPSRPQGRRATVE